MVMNSFQMLHQEATPHLIRSFVQMVREGGGDAQNPGLHAPDAMYHSPPRDPHMLCIPHAVVT